MDWRGLRMNIAKTSTELGVEYFIATQTDEKLRHKNIEGKENAYKIYSEVVRKVGQTVKELGGTMLEDLPTPEKNVRQIEKEQEKKKMLEGDGE
jgi:DNA-damage-inducible protein D